MAKSERNGKDEKQSRAKQQRLQLQWEEGKDRSRQEDAETSTSPDEGNNHAPAEESDRKDSGSGTTENAHPEPVPAEPTSVKDEPADSKETDQPQAASDGEKNAPETRDERKTTPPPRRTKQPDKARKRRAAAAEKNAEGDSRVVQLGEVETTFGQALLEARGACNMSIAQVAQKTKIPPRFIQAIEGDKYSQLPSPIYSRSYIKQLCRIYEIPCDKILERYEQECGQATQPPAAVKPQRPAPSEPVEEHRIYPRIKREVAPGKLLQNVSRYAVMFALAALVILVLIAFAVQQVHNYRMRQAQKQLPEDPAAQRPDIQLEEFIVPQALPVKELPIPES